MPNAMNHHLVRRRSDRVAERLRPTGSLVCPVCARGFEPDEEAEPVKFAGQVMWLCGERCFNEFDRQPLRFAD